MMCTDTSLAAGEFQQAVDAILPYSVNYSESLGLVESVDVAALLGQYPAGAVIVFLPNNGAYYNTYVAAIDAIFLLRPGSRSGTVPRCWLLSRL
jgi:hypothetical protein